MAGKAKRNSGARPADRLSIEGPKPVIPFDIHWSWAHQGPEDYQAFRDMQPGAIWILNPDHEICRLAHEAAPTALLILRDQPQGEQHDFMRADPLGCARAHMADWVKHVPEWAGMVPRAQVAVCGINEGLIDTLEREVAVCAYYSELVKLGTAAGIAVAAGAFGNGWPGNDDTDKVKDTRVHWDRPHFRALLEAVRTGRGKGVGHFLNLHEYYGDQAGPRGIWGWQSGRVLQLLEWFKVWGWNPEDVPIRLGEFGFDRLAIDSGCKDPGKRGWASWMPSTVYMGQLNWLLQQYAFYPSIKGAAVFGWDAQNAEWNGFDIRPAREEVVAMVKELRAQVAPSVTRVVLPAAIKFPASTPAPGPSPAPAPTRLIEPLLAWPLGAVAGTLTNEFGSNAVNYSAFGLIGHNGRDIAAPAGTPVVATHAGQCWVYNDPAGYGNVVEIWNPMIAGGSPYKTISAHLSRFAVINGQRVEPGMVIGYVGSTGNSSGNHLHFGIKLLQGRNPGYANWVDPKSFMAR